MKRGLGPKICPKYAEFLKFGQGRGVGGDWSDVSSVEFGADDPIICGGKDDLRQDLWSNQLSQLIV